MAKKTNTERIVTIYDMAKEHFGEVRFVGLKYHDKIGWVAKIQFDNYESLIEEGEDSTEALRNLKRRVKKIINRYHLV
ncbi:MAG: hypothetical protein ACQESH_00930 [Campylobacterota bacterium]